MSRSSGDKAKLLRKQGYRCRLCRRRLVRLAALVRLRTVVQRRGGWVCWLSPAGDIARALVATRDHIIPRRVVRSLGHNGQALCTACHAEKSAIDARQFAQPPERYDFCVECRSLLSWGPASCPVCRFYRGAPIVAWLVRSDKARR